MTLYIDTRTTLEWVDYNGISFAEGSYKVRLELSNNKWIWSYMDYWYDKGYYNTLDQAKAAAQADYESRTAERFRAVKLPSRKKPSYYWDHDENSGYNDCIDDIHEAIAKAQDNTL
jgi:hypothetical protein